MSEKILIAEDDKFLAIALIDKLKKENFEVITAVNGEEALAKVKNEKPNLVLLDLIMPVKNGFEVLEEMKLSGELKTIPVIVLSNLGQQEDVKKCRDIGAVDYLVKADWTMAKVVEKIKEHLARNKS